MFMRLQGLFLAMPLSNNKQIGTAGSVFPHQRHYISSILFTPVPRTMDNLQDKLHEIEATKSSYNIPSLQIQPTETVPIDVEEVRQFVRKLNSEEKIKNLDKFPGRLKDKSMVIIIQVHNRPDYFAHLLRSLSKVRGIEDALLVTSHDFYNEYINSLVDAINFCKVIDRFSRC